ncbi:protein BatD [Thalassotalea sp. M1531]|uniref:Protein BatD n=1 Tax=Thalassotalea algicola TaxID=2716224 RepID=A0A7Y0LG25_9GAMM|nr:BatD family protein [Thalassotalea algicola]NMP32986.1 protein BatD [Thalassotalea algicola]
MVRILFIVLLTFIAPSTYALTQVTATVDRNPVTVKESLILTVIADDDVDTNALNTAPLLSNFIVGRTSVSTQTSMVNFKTSRTTKWQTVLIPKQTGTIVIPPLTVEGQKTAPITLTVLDGNDPAANSQRDVFITASVSNNQVYVQQMLTLTVKLHFAAELKRGSLTEPELTGAAIAQVGKDAESETIINGRRYRVIERTFSVTPQQSGEFMLRSPMFSGEIMVQSARRSNFLSFGETKAISVLGDEVPITVKAMPESFQGHWLPSELLTLHQEWQPDVSQFKVGEPITRTITLTAVGVSEEQLPELTLNLPKGLKVYPDQQTAHSNVTNGRFVSQTVNNFAIVASQPGQYTMPAVDVSWWNTVTNRIEVSSLPAQTINVLANEDVDITNLPATPLNNNASSTPTGPIETVIVEKSPLLQWLFLALWILTMLAWLTVELLRRKTNGQSEHQVEHSVDNLQLAILAACKQGNGKQVLSLLVPWFNGLARNNNVSTISELKKYCNNEVLVKEIDNLQQALFGHSAEKECTRHWDSKPFVAALKTYLKQKSANSVQPLGSLNP